MTKITNLPEVGELNGDEQVVLVKGNATGRALLRHLLSSTALVKEGDPVGGTGFVDVRQSQLRNLRAGEAPFDAVRMDQAMLKGGGEFFGALDMRQNDVGNLPPTETVPPYSAVRKQYVEENFVKLLGDGVGGTGFIDTRQSQIKNIRAGEAPFDAVRMDQAMLKGGGEFFGALDMRQNDIGNLPPTEDVPPFSAARKQYVDDKVASIAEQWTEDDKAILWPTPVAFVAGRKNTIYGRQIVHRRARQSHLDVHLISSAEVNAGQGLSLFLAPQAAFHTEELVNPLCRIEVKDEGDRQHIWSKDFTALVANDVQSGEIKVCFLGDSTAALGFNAFISQLMATGATFRGYGTRPLVGSDHYEGRPSWSAMDYMGRTRPTTFGVNPFLRSLSVSVPAELAIIQANAAKCFADDASFGIDARPSYAQDSSRARYSLFSWAYWRSNPAVALTGTEKLRVVFQLGRNGTGSETWIADNDLAQNHIVDDFLATFANGTMIVASEALGDGDDINNSMVGATGYRDFTAPLIAKKIAWFANRAAQRVYLAPAWALMDAYGAFDLGDAVAIDNDTGTQKRLIQDVVHYSSQRKAQWASAIIAPLLYAHQTS